MISAIVVGITVATLALTAATADAEDTGTHGDPSASPGCGASAHTPGRSLHPFSAAGLAGGYIQDIPTGPTDLPMPMVLDLHGYNEPPAVAHLMTGLAAYGESHGFVTITPQVGASPFPVWPLDSNDGTFEFLSALITQVGSTACIDERRVFVTGMSMGGITAVALTCRLADRVAAVAPVAGLQILPGCSPARPVPLVAFHGTDDPLLAYTGGIGALLRDTPGVPAQTVDLPAIPDNAATWARQNGCGADPTEQQVAVDVVVHTYACPGGADVVLYTIIGGGHVWPGSTSSPYPAALVGPNTTSIDATRIMWDFFQAHPLPA
ncbi:alpha/beta hydrolase family esterase [Nocardia bovistercoris]|uniref:Esterase n=1 Tax=Nocardia bovistercoris TaxID=2785916 RepID=A0A931IL75_9NOCA|nr:hypothetical protein [Nocardia bovistercoris]MBH0781563.1 hypothetical protein [Nocardia bovistercoris]